MKKKINQIPMSVKASALHKANLIKINKINNILVLDNNFNAKMDSVHYDNNKLILENSKILNKPSFSRDKNKNTTSPKELSLASRFTDHVELMGIHPNVGSNLRVSKKIETLALATTSPSFSREGDNRGKALLSTKLTTHGRILQRATISLNDTSLSLLSPLSKGIGTITELFKPKKEKKEHDFLNESNLNKKAVANVGLALNKNISSNLNILNRSKISPNRDGNNLNNLNFISSILSTQGGDSIALKNRLAVAHSEARGNKTIHWTSISNQSNNTSRLSDRLVNKEEQSIGDILNTKVQIASLNKIKASSSISQKVYDSITLAKATGSPTLPTKVNEGKNKTIHWTNLSLKDELKKINVNKEQSIGQDNTIIHKYLSNITKSNSHINTNPNVSKKYGILLNYNRSIGYTFLNKILDKNKNTNLISEFKEEIYNLLFYFFKSIFCIISKPTILFSPDKITIRLFYYLVIPKKRVLKLFAIYYIKKFRNEWMEKKRLKNTSSINLGKLSLLKLGYDRNEIKSDINSNRSISFYEVLGFKRGTFQHNRLSEKIKNQSSNASNGAIPKKFNIFKDNNNIKKIRLPFMKFKVRKVISRLKSKPTLIRDIYINLRKFNIVKVFHNKFLLLTKILSRLFNKPIVLEITRIHNFKYDSNILANAIQFVVKNKRKNPRVAINKVYRKKNIKLLNDPNLTPINKVITFLSGLNIYINGRLMREPIIPRITTKKFEKGATATGKVNYIDTSYITKKNRKGAYTIKVKSAQNFL